MGDVAVLGPQLWALMAWPNIGWLEILKKALSPVGARVRPWACGAVVQQGAPHWPSFEACHS